jgi:hypothetical protein
LGKLLSIIHSLHFRIIWSDSFDPLNEKYIHKNEFIFVFRQNCRTTKLNKTGKANWRNHMSMDSRLTFRMTAKQLDQLRRYAEEQRMTLSHAARRLVLETTMR